MSDYYGKFSLLYGLDFNYRERTISYMDEIYCIDIPDKDIFYVWTSSAGGHDDIDIELVDSFDEIMEEYKGRSIDGLRMINYKNCKAEFDKLLVRLKNKEKFDYYKEALCIFSPEPEDLFGIPTLRMIEETYFMNGFEILVQSYNTKGYAHWKLYTFKGRLKRIFPDHIINKIYPVATDLTFDFFNNRLVFDCKKYVVCICSTQSADFKHNFFAELYRYVIKIPDRDVFYVLKMKENKDGNSVFKLMSDDEVDIKLREIIKVENEKYNENQRSLLYYQTHPYYDSNDVMHNIPHIKTNETTWYSHGFEVIEESNKGFRYEWSLITFNKLLLCKE